MNNLIKKHTLFLALFIALGCVFGLSSCSKNAECTAVITVVDTAAKPLSGASVKLYYAPPAGSSATPVTTVQSTDGSGKTTFVFKLQAIFDIDVTYTGTTATKVGVIKLEPGETVNKTVVFK